MEKKTKFSLDSLRFQCVEYLCGPNPWPVVKGEVEEGPLPRLERLPRLRLFDLAGDIVGEIAEGGANVEEEAQGAGGLHGGGRGGGVVARKVPDARGEMAPNWVTRLLRQRFVLAIPLLVLFQVD